MTVIVPPINIDMISAPPRLGMWHRKIDEEISDTAILVLGDSTGAENTPARWPRLLANTIAAQWPRQTVIYHPWDDASKTYPGGSVITVQTGASGRTIHIYNVSVSGQVVGYAYNTVGTITAGLAVDPDLIIWNYGHNSPQDLDNYRGLTHQAVNEYAARYPNAAMVITAQNPRATFTTGNTLTADYAPDQLRQRANFEYAMAEGHPCVDVNASYRAYGDYNADFLVDGLHPNASGSARWAGLTWLVIQPKVIGDTMSSPASRTSRIWIPAKCFDALDGSPSYSNSTFGVGTWALDPDSEESISAVLDYPSDWKLANFDAIVAAVSAPGASLRTVALLASYQYAGGTNSGIGSAVLGTWVPNAAGNSNVTLTTTAAQTVAGTVFNRTGFSRRPVGFKIARKAADAADNLPQDLHFLGLMIQRMY